MQKFDPINERKYWLDVGLKSNTNFEPDEIGPLGRPTYVAVTVDSLIGAYFFGLGEEVRPAIEKIIAWMEAQPSIEPRQFSAKFGHWRAGWSALYRWRTTLGLCKWLSRGDPAEMDFIGALDADWQSWTMISPKDAALDRGEQQDNLSEQLAVALAAKEPGRGLKLVAAADVKEPFEHEAPLLKFGEWACRHLASGGKRDATFIENGAQMLSASLLANFFSTGNRTEPALWLKAIYWDSGVARTPEQAIVRAYDCMPGITRPDFVSV